MYAMLLKLLGNAGQRAQKFQVNVLTKIYNLNALLFNVTIGS